MRWSSWYIQYGQRIHEVQKLYTVLLHAELDHETTELYDDRTWFVTNETSGRRWAVQVVRRVATAGQHSGCFLPADCTTMLQPCYAGDTIKLWKHDGA